MPSRRSRHWPQRGPRCRPCSRLPCSGSADERGAPRRSGARGLRATGRGRAATATAGGVPWADPRSRPTLARAGSGQPPRVHPGPHPAVRPPGPRQDDARHDRGGRGRPADPHHQRARDPTCRRPGLDSVLADRRRGPVPRRDPPDVAGRRGDVVPRHGGLPRRRHRGQGARSDRDSPRAAPLHRRGGHDPGGVAAGAAARPVRLHRAPRLLRHRGPRDDFDPLGAAARRRSRASGSARDRRAVPWHPSHRQPAAAPGARLGAGARSWGRRPRGRAHGAGALRRRRRRARPVGPRRARRDVSPVRRRPGGP